MNDRHQGENLKIEVEYISEDSNNSIDDFKATQKLISLVPEGTPPEKHKSKNKKVTLVKKNTRISSNNDEDLEYLDNENNSDNFNIQITDNIKTSTNNFFTDSDDVKLDQEFDGDHGYVFTFTMPAHDVSLMKSLRFILRFLSFDIGHWTSDTRRATCSVRRATCA